MVHAQLPGLDYPSVASLLHPLHACVQPNQTRPATESPREILCPFQLGSAHALFSHTLRIPALGHEAGLWEEERAGERRGMGPDHLLIALFSDIVLFP